MTDNRPEFLNMIADSKKEEFDIVLVHKLDRFARNRQDSIGYRMELKRHGSYSSQTYFQNVYRRLRI